MIIDFNKLLYDKVQAEYDAFIEALTRLTPKEVIEKAYEKVIKENMLIEIQQCSLDEMSARALYLKSFPLDFLYREWLDTDVSIMELLRDSISDTADNAAKELDEEHHTVSTPGCNGISI